MSGLGILLAVAGLLVTTMVIVAMILLTPRGNVEVHVEGTEAGGSNLSPTKAPAAPVAVATTPTR